MPAAVAALGVHREQRHAQTMDDFVVMIGPFPVANLAPDRLRGSSVTNHKPLKLANFCSRACEHGADRGPTRDK